ncbi:MAG: GxxExxY protein [Candidatus Doudnabacteria bacterium]|nr:GxxExxY protein [Candidatus Doudnabacteria bacterium]
MPSELKRDDLIYPKECYEIVGILMEVYKKLGSGYQEKYYQRGIAEELRLRNKKFAEQVAVPLLYKEKKLGTYFLDFLVEIGDAKIVVEIKKDDHFSKHNIEQVVGYLKATNLKLGILANFTPKGVRYKRIINL